MSDWGTFPEWGEGIGSAGTVMRANAMRAGLDAWVPTCPEWHVRDLVTHQGVVHRWATAVLEGKDVTADLESRVRAEAGAAVDLLDWLDDGMVAMLNTLATAPEDLDVWFFLRTEPHPRDGWARRQCHETTIHAVDAMSAALGRMPLAEELWITPRLATDGIDEILTGFVPRGSSRLHTPTQRRIVVKTDGAGWVVEIGPGAATVKRDDSPPKDADLTLSGPPVPLYLALWNRGDAPAARGDLGLLTAWRDLMRISWA